MTHHLSDCAVHNAPAYDAGPCYCCETPCAHTPGDTPSPTGGLRYNAGKPRFDLLPPEGLAALVEVYTKGAAKYAPRNWEKGMAWSETCFAALQRHAWKWMAGEDRDPETGCSHMAHVAWNALALVVYQARGVGLDDRPVLIQEATNGA